MEISEVVTLMQTSLMTLLIIAGPLLAVGLVVGLVVSILQATTSIQEQTLTFVPKILAMVAVLFIFGGSMLALLVEFTANIFELLPGIAR